MFLIIITVTLALAQDGYFQIESYSQFPAFVDAKSFHPRDDSIENSLRRSISLEVFRALIAQNGESSYAGCDYLIGGAYCNSGTGIAVSSGPPISYRVLKKIYGELIERNLTFVCMMRTSGPVSIVYIPFTSVDPYGPMPVSLRLKRL